MRNRRHCAGLHLTAVRFCNIYLLFLAGCTFAPFESNYHPATLSGQLSSPPVCPDRKSAQLFQTDSTGKTWLMTPCETLVVSAAINHCIIRTSHSGNLSNFISGFQDGAEGVLTLSAAAAGVAGLIVGSAPAALTGLGVAVASVSTDLSKISPGSQATTSVQNMLTSAQTYAQINQSLVPPNNVVISAGLLKGNSYTTNSFYAGLWNAAGSACPSTLFGHGFVNADLPPPGNMSYRTPVNWVPYTVESGDNAGKIAIALSANINSSSATYSIFATTSAKPTDKSATVDLTTTAPGQSIMLNVPTITPKASSAAPSVNIAVHNGAAPQPTTLTIISDNPSPGDVIAITGALSPASIASASASSLQGNTPATGQSTGK